MTTVRVLTGSFFCQLATSTLRLRSSRELMGTKATKVSDAKTVDGNRVLQPRTVLITGANRGLGLEMVKQLLKLPQPPAAIIGTCRSLSQAQELQKIATDNPNVHILQLDVTHFDKVPEFVEKVAAIVGDRGLNLLINNAGIFGYAPVGDTGATPVEGFMEHMNVHVVSPFAMVKGLLPLLKQAAAQRTDAGLDINKAAVVNVSSSLGSIASVQPGPFTPLYAYRTAKAGLTMLSKLMGLDLAQYGILSFAVHPGWVQTDMGGPMAPLKVDESISKVLHVLANVKAEHAGLHVSFDGSIVPW